MSKGSDRGERRTDKAAERTTEADSRPLGFGAVPESPALAVESPPNGVDSRTGKPYCGRHNCLMRAASSRENVVYYRCPVDGCDEREKRTRAGANVPAMPALCSRITCRDEKIALEVDAASSSIGQLKMVCRKCGQASYVPAPGYAYSQARVRLEPPVEDFAAR